MAARTTAIATFAIFFIFGVGCSWRGAVARCGPWGGCVDNGRSCGVVLKLSKRFFGALAGARFFFGFRPRLLGIGKQPMLADGLAIAIVMEHCAGLFDKDEPKHNVATLNCH